MNEIFKTILKHFEHKFHKKYFFPALHWKAFKIFIEKQNRNTKELMFIKYLSALKEQVCFV